MPLTLEEQKELEILEAELAEPQKNFSGLTPQEQKELEILEAEFGHNPDANKGFFSRIGEDIAKRSEQATQIQSERRAGQIGRPEEIYTMAGVGAGLVGDVTGELVAETIKGISHLDKLTGGYGSAGISNVVRSVGNLPSFGGGSIGERLPSEIDYLQNSYSSFKNKNPRAARIVESSGNLALMFPAIKYADDISFGVRGVGKSISKSEIAKLTSDDLRDAGAKLFKKADEVGGVLKPSFINKYSDNIKDIMPKTEMGKELLSGDKADFIQNVVFKYRDKPSTFQQLKELDEVLGDLAYEKVDAFGKFTPDGLKIVRMQNELRNLVDTADEGFFLGGREAFNIAKDARKYWSASLRLRDIERIIEKSKYAEQPARALKNGFTQLIDKRSRLSGFTKEEVFAIKKAAKTGSLEGFLKLGGSGLVPIAAAASTYSAGGIGAIPAYAYQQLSKKGSEAIAFGKAMDVENAIKRRVFNSEIPSKVSAISDLSRALKDATGLTASVGAVRSFEEQEKISDRARRIFGVK